MPVGLCPVPIKVSQTKYVPADLEAMNHKLARLSPIERIKWANDKFAGSLVLPTTFGPTSPVLLKLATDVVPGIPVATIRHGHETKRTRELAEWYKTKFSLNLHLYEAPYLPIPDENTPKFEAFKRQIKIEPFQQMLDELQPAVYLSGIMRWQTSYRQDLPFIQDKGSVLSINPVLDMTEENVDKFFLATGLPRNEDYYDPAKGAQQDAECGCNTAIYR